ncbi:endonuclease-reverse transcriptase [Plakobranchus ocellatus]|uniref:Endonuclease-reverse transcriptase n=1 Tax=Plakobranchus ocellatus TaxID=259542 RepID=A0AAV3XSW6_9GAST|nr:endonuclease-reverse transcriptase [Plakobranchus ocellatus]
MGVHGLWQLLQPAGRPVSLESLEGKVLAVDVSIWLHQTMKGMRDKDGNPLPNAHLQGLFSRVCKLLFYRIKPVFVFDGGVPVLKKKTLAARKDRREEAERESTAVAEKLLQNLVKSQAVKQALGDQRRLLPVANASSASKQGRIPGVRRGRNQKDVDIFNLMPLPKSEELSLIKETENWERDFEKQENWIKEGLAALSDTHPDADEFKSLPAEIQHEILKELKESKKYHSLSHLTKMPEDSEDFSSYQLKRLMKQCRLTTRMEEIRREMSNQAAQDLASSLHSQYAGEECGAVKREFGDQVEARRIVSEDASHYVLIKGISSHGQMQQADKYHLEQTVKTEDVESEDEVEPQKQSVTPTSPEKKFQLASVKIMSTDDSDSDMETVVSRRMKRKRKPGQGLAKRSRIGLERKKITAAMKVKENDGSSKAAIKMVPQRQSNSSSEDEGFIEVTVDPDAPMEEDELFPASIFEVEAASSNDNRSNVVEKNVRATSQVYREKKDGQQNIVKEKEENMKKSESPPKQGISTRKEDNHDNAHLRDVVEAELGSIDRNRLGYKHHLRKPEMGHKEVLNSINSQLEKKKNETKACDSPTAKRKSVLIDILGQLQEKKKKLNEEIQEISSDDTLLLSTTNEFSETKGELSSELGGQKRKLSHPTDDEAAAIGGGFVPEESSEPDDPTEESSDVGQLKWGVEVQKEASASPASDSDEDLKLAKQLSLQTDVVQSREDRDSDLDEDLKLAIKLSLEASESEPQVEESETKKNYSEETPKSKLRNYPFGAGESSSSEEDLEGFEDVTEVEERTLSRDGAGSSDSSQKKNVEEAEPKDRPQPEDFEVDDETESRAYVSTLTEHDLHDMRDELESERSVLLSQQGRQNRMAASVTEQTNLDAQDLLRLFGVPFIISPLEAEAQCAFLEAAGLTEGTITDDSDFWLFGGHRMYKNFFNQSKHVELYTMDNIHNHFSLSRQQLINIALLCGSDYTEGIQGVGPVRALEIMAEFPGSGLEGLYKFRQWWDKSTKKPGTIAIENKIRARLKNLTLIPGFPSEAVVDAYMNPTVDDSLEKFSWAAPDLDLLREFCKFKFGWAKEKSDQTLVPMFKAWSKTQSQGRISSYFGAEAFVQTSKIKSDRLRKALEMVKNPSAGEGASDTPSDGQKVKRSHSGKSVKEKSRQKEGVDKSDRESSKQAKEDGETLDVVSKGKKVKTKHVTFADADESNNDLVTSKPKKGEEPEFLAERKGDEGRAQDDDFMIRMSEKVKKAKGDLERMDQARNFACVKEKAGNIERGKGQAKGKTRGGEMKKIGSKNIPVSLDIPRRSTRSRRGRSARGGRAAAAKLNKTVNLSESSSDSNHSDDDVDDDDNDSEEGGNHSKKVQHTVQKVGINQSRKKSLMPALTVKTPQFATRKALGAEMVTRTLVSSNMPVKDINDEATGITTLKTEDMKRSRPKPRKVQNNLSINTTDLRSNVKDHPFVKGGDLGTIGKQNQNVERDDDWKNVASGKPDKPSFGKNAKTHNTPPSAAGIHAVESTELSNAKESRESKKTSPMAKTIMKLKDSLPDKEDQTIEHNNENEESEAVDISKADVSVINRRNLPATLAYLNQRSKQDKVLLSQISGRRLRNAVELRIEQEERRPAGQCLRKDPDNDQRAKRTVDNTTGLSFEDALGGVHAKSVASVRAKKKNKSESIQGNKTEQKSTKIPMQEEKNKAKRKKIESRESTQIKMYDDVSSIDKVSKQGAPHSKSSLKTEKDVKGQIEDGKRDSSSMMKSSRQSNSNASAFSTSRDKSFDTSVPDGETELENMEHRCKELEEDNEEFQDNHAKLGKRKEEEAVKTEKVKLKSKRSHAFDRPIRAVGSDEDNFGSPRASFQKQLQHLHESRSVKGHGPLYLSAAGQEFYSDKEIGRAYAGKGKGRGKNRTVGTSQGDSAITQKEREEYENLTIEDLGSDFSDNDF